MTALKEISGLPDGFEIFTVSQRPDLESQMLQLNPAVIPEFMHHDAVAGRYWPKLFTDFADFQLAVCDGAGEVVAAGYTIPVFWDGTIEGLSEGWDAALEQGNRALEGGRVPTVLSALLAVVSRTNQKQGLSSVIIRAMRTIAENHGFHTLIAPVRPTLKDRYPLTPMERCVRWERKDGLPFDPWMRVHRRLGAEILRVAPRSMRITGTISEWEEWTGMRFPESGPYVVPGALVPVEMDVERDLGIYEEPNVWMSHAVGKAG